MSKYSLGIQQRAFKNTIVGIISFVFSLVQTIITVPVLLKYWGNEKYGVWIALYASFILLQSLDTGHIGYISNKMNVTYHTDKNELRKTLASSLIMAIIIGIIQIVITLILIVFNFLPDILGLSPKLMTEYSVQLSLFILITFWLLSGSIGGILHRIMLPTGFYYQSQWWMIFYRFCQFISIVIVAILGGNILLATLMYVITQLLVYGLSFIYIKQNIPEFYPWWQGADLRISFKNFKNSIVLTFTSFIQQLSNNGLLLLISNLLSSVYLPVFATIRTMTNTALTITNILIQAVLPDFIRYHTEKDKVKLNSVFNANWFFSGLIVNAGLVLVIPFAETLFNFWTKKIIVFDYNLFVCLVASISIINFGIGLYNYIYSLNNLKAITVITLARVALLFGCAYSLSGPMGLTGIGVAVVISEIAASIILPYFYVQRTLKTFNANLDIKSSLTAAFTPLIIIIFSSASVLGVTFNYYLWAATLFLIILSYIFNWYILNSEVKERTLILIKSTFTRSNG